MRKILSAFSFLVFSIPAFSQTAVLPVSACVQPGVQASVSGLKSVNYLQGIIPQCTVTVYLTGTTTLATTTPQSPFTANTNGSIPPIYAAINQGYDVVLSGGVSPNIYPSPVTLTGLYPATNISAGCGLGSPCTVAQGGTSAATAAVAAANIVNGNPISPSSVTSSINNTINPMAAPYNAACNGTTDDHNALAAALAALGPSSGYYPGAVEIPAGTTCVNNSGPLDIGGAFRTLKGAGLGSNISCTPSTTQEACVRGITSGDLTLTDLSISCMNGNTTYCVELTTPTSAEATKISNLSIYGGVYPLAIGQNTSADQSGVRGNHIVLTGTSATTACLLVGNGSSGNVLNNSIDGVDMNNCPTGALLQGGSMSLSHVGFNCEQGGCTDIHITVESSTPETISDVRTEGSSTFLQVDCCVNTAAEGSVTVTGVNWFGMVHGSGTSVTAIAYTSSVPLIVSNSTFASNTSGVDYPVLFNISGSTGHPTPVVFQNVGATSTATSSLASYLTLLVQNPLVSLFSVNDFSITTNYSLVGPGTGKMLTSGGFSALGNGSVGGNMAIGGNVDSALFSTGPYANYVTHSLFDNGITSWPEAGSVSATYTTNSGTDIFGNTTAMKVVIPAGAGQSWAINQTTGLTMQAGSTYQFSAYLQGNAGGEVAVMRLNTINGCNPTSGTFPVSFSLTTTRTLYSWQCTPTANTTAIPYIGVNSAAGAVTLWVSQPQVCQVGVNCAAQVVTTTAALTGSGAISYGSVSSNLNASVTGAGSSQIATIPGTVAAGTGFAVGANLVIPATATGFHGSGSGDVSVQMSDGTGTSAHYAVWDATGGLTNGAAVANPFTAVTITSNAGTLATGGAAFTNGTVALSHSATTTINVSGLVNGASFNLRLTQDSTGGNVLALGTGCTWLAGTNSGFVASTTPALSAAANGINVLSAIYDGTNCLYNVR